MSILQKLAEDNIVSFELIKDKTKVEIEECCVNHFKAELNRIGMIDLIIELLLLVKQMEDKDSMS